MKYVSFKSLGTNGDMCSQMQQYASLVAVAIENMAEGIVLPESTRNDGFGIRLFDVLDIPHKFLPDEEFRGFKEFNLDGSKIVDNNVFNLNHMSHTFVRKDDSVFINGRFDLFHYWYPKYKDVVNSWRIHDDLVDDAKKFLDDLKQNYPTTNTITSIHIRLGDYLHPQHSHFVQLWKTDYYNDAVERLNSSDNLFIVFTNDPVWCKQHIIDDTANVIFVNTGSDELDFTIMSMCDHNIIANSSFSWWAAYLNKNPTKIVICPKQYLRGNSEFSHINGNYYPPEWYAIDVTENL